MSIYNGVCVCVCVCVCVFFIIIITTIFHLVITIVDFMSNNTLDCFNFLCPRLRCCFHCFLP